MLIQNKNINESSKICLFFILNNINIYKIIGILLKKETKPSINRN